MFMNRVDIIGRLGQDPEIHHTASGQLIVRLNIATSESWKDRTTGARRERTEWHSVVIFAEGLGKMAQQHLKSGMRVRVEGSLRSRKWEKDGQSHTTTEIIVQQYGGTIRMMDPQTQAQKKEDEWASGAPPADSEPGYQPPASSASSASRGPLDDEELPF